MNEVTDRLRIWLWIPVFVISAIAFGLSFLSGFTLNPRSIFVLAVYACFGLGICFRNPMSFGRYSRLMTLIEWYILFTIISILGAVFSYLSMTYSGEFVDDFLHVADQTMGFDWPSIRSTVSSYPPVYRLLNAAYFICFLMPFIVFALLYFTRQIDRSYAYIAAYGLALAATIAIFFFFPARAAFSFYLNDGPGTPENARHYGAMISQLKAGSPIMLDLAKLEGIVTFPSFHAAMAILFVWATWPIRLARLLMVVGNGLMWIAAVPIGGHYAVDLIGGSLIAIASIAVVGRITKRATLIETPPAYPAAIQR